MSLKLEAEIGLESSGFEKGIERSLDSVKELAIEAIGITTVGEAFKKTIESALEFGETVSRGSERLNISAREFQAYSYALTRGGVEIGAFESSLDRLAKSQEDAGSKSGKMRSALYEFGLTLDDIKDKTPSELFDQISESIAATGTNSQKTAALMEIFGKGAGNLIPLMKELKENKEIGGLLAIPDGDIKRLDEAGKAVKTVGFNLKTIGAGLVAKALDPIGSMASLFYGAGSTKGQGGINRQAILDRHKATAAFVANGYSDEVKDHRAPEETESTKQDKTKTLEIEKEITAEKEKQRLSGLTDAQKRIELARQIKDLEYQVKQAPYEGLSGSETAEKKLSLAKLNTEKTGLDRKLPRERKIASDPLISVGNFLGSSKGAIGGAQARLEAHAAETAANTKQMVTTLTKLADKINPSFHSGEGTLFPG